MEGLLLFIVIARFNVAINRVMRLREYPGRRANIVSGRGGRGG